MTTRHLLIAILLLPTLLFAQTVPPPSDQGPIVGLYTTAEMGDDTDVFLEITEVPQQFEVHAIISHPGVDSVAGVEFRINQSPEFEAASYYLSSVNGDPGWCGMDWPNVLMGFSTPRPAVDGHAWVLTATYLVGAEFGDGTFSLGPTPVQSIPGEMAIAQGDNPDNLIVIRPNSEGLAHDQPVFHITAGTVPVTGRTLTTVKALFH